MSLLYSIQEGGRKINRIIPISITVFVTFLLFFGTIDFPNWGDPAQPSSVHVSPRYIERSLQETATPNIVTSILADYRGYDTLFETVVIFTASVSVMMLLRRSKGER